MKPIYRILGAGEWGIAVGHHLARQDHQVEIYGRSSEKFDNFKKWFLRKTHDTKNKR